MIAAVDTNILLDILIPNENYYDASSAAIEHAAGHGLLVICDMVYAELCGQFEHQHDCDAFLDASEIRVQALSREAHFRASRAWRAYRSRGGKRNRILADFLIGAHAEKHANSLISRDRGFYGDYFPGLVLVDPTSKGSH